MVASSERSIPLLTEYALGWCLHQLAPFLDKMLGVAGAMDHRMIDKRYDWYLRLPLVVLCMLRPTHPHYTRGALLIAHVISVVCWFDRMPAVWDYMCWCALLETTFIGAALLSASSEECARRFLPAARAQLIVLYMSAAFWKLTTSWFDTRYSCATVLMSELLAGLEPLLPPVRHLSTPLLYGAPALVAGIEFAVPAMLLLRPRWGVLLALVFHQTINLMPTTYAGVSSRRSPGPSPLSFPSAPAAAARPSPPGWVCDDRARDLRGRRTRCTQHAPSERVRPPALHGGWPPRAQGFSIAMCCRLVIFLPGATNALTHAKLPGASAALVALATAFMTAIHGGLDCHGGMFLLLALFYFCAISAPPPAATTETLPPPATYAIPKMVLVVALCVCGSLASVLAALGLLALWAPLSPAAFVKRALPGGGGLPTLTACAVVGGFVYGFVHPVIGVQMMASSTMYGNVKNYGGSNHMLVPTGLLQDWLADPQVAAAAPAWLADDFGGGLVRVERTTSSALLQLAVQGAELTSQLPPRARELLASVNASGRYFEFYAARNYFTRKGDLEACALNAIDTGASVAPSTADPPYVVPAYELRRALALARERKEPFELEYTRLPPKLHLPSEWMAHLGETVVVQDAADGTPPSCTLVQRYSLWPLGRSACASDEIALLRPPRPWLSKLLLPYPTPLFEGSGDGIHCTT